MLDLKKFSEVNRNRATEGFKTYKNVPLTYWTTALAGEIGELCNMIKKMERVSHGGIDGGSSYTASSITREMIEEEIGGVFIYLDLLSGLLGISLEDAIINTFNAKSKKYGFRQIDSEGNPLRQCTKDPNTCQVAFCNFSNCLNEKAEINPQKSMFADEELDDLYKDEGKATDRYHR